MEIKIYVYADWALPDSNGLPSPQQVGVLTSSLVRNKELFNFQYSPEWLASPYALPIDPELHLFAGHQYSDGKNFRIFLDSCPDRWGRLLMKRREAAIPILQKIKFILSEYKYRQYEKIIIKNADIIAFQSAFDKESLLSRNKNYLGNAVVIPGNIGGKWFDPAYKDSNSSEKLKTIIFIGAINQRKGIKYLIEAFIKLIEVGYDLELVIAGKGVLENKIKAMLEQANVFERVRFIGRVNNPLEHIAKADLMIVPSIFDSFPDVILESLHVGTPVLAANSGGVADMVSKYDLFEVANSEAIIDKILILLGSDDEYRKLKANQQKYRDRFNFDWAQSFISEMEKY